MIESYKGLPVIYFESQSELEKWLDENHVSSEGVWLKLAKKTSGIVSVSYMEAVEASLCYGWIDSQKAGYDVSFWLQRFTPRRPKSRWSRDNRDKATELIERGRMKPAGLREVKQAKGDGRWEAAYASQSKMEIPQEFQQKLDQNPAAQDFFATLNAVNRYAFLYRIQDAKKPETRTKRMDQFIQMLNEHKTIY
jgi:uncharacterized protein YdeI (YjbR/CyaY-like superfamily)